MSANFQRQARHSHHRATLQCSRFSTSGAAHEEGEIPLKPSSPADGPTGSLFEGSSLSSSPATASKEASSSSLHSLVGQSAQVLRTFSPESNAQAMLTCGGPSLAAHASFDPNYGRAVRWIQNHAVGPAVLSPILISGLVGALVEAAFPQAVCVQHSLTLTKNKPLIVGVTVQAHIQVTAVDRGEAQNDDDDDEEEDSVVSQRQMGYHVHLDTSVTRVQDGATIAKGTQTIWIPDYLHM